MPAETKTRLVVVESPTKARTIRSFLPRGYRVAASMGHVRDLPESASEIPPSLKGEDWARLGVNVRRDFEPLYVTPAAKKKVIGELKTLLKDADELVVATDEDREGESIGWHLVQVLRPKVPVSRIVFHEITPEAIRAALQRPRDIDDALVRAQETRRILDRLVGYTVSPLLWKKIASGLSAGRVQSVAVKLLVDRERERRAFRSGTYWDLKATLQKQAARFGAALVSVAGQRVSTGKDFDESTGRLKDERAVLLLDEAQANALRERLLAVEWTVRETEEKPAVRRPYPPFTTSTLQQEANRKLRLSARDTMQVAQRLYEQGYITYMRTDSVHLSEQAIRAARQRIELRYGREYLSPQPRQFTTQSKGAQEAHEAIRPAGTEMKTAAELNLAGREKDLYDLIWKRTVASQMADARITQLSALIAADDALFRASGRRIDFPGFFRAYVEGSDDPDAALEDREEPLPHLARGDRLTLHELEALGHQTQPPARYTDASLVRTLESEGIGRPSTYASIIGTILDRGYATRVTNQLVPTFTAFAVTELLEKHFASLVDTRFTAEMEEQLDAIAEGEAEWLPYLHAFYDGPSGLEEKVREGEAEIDPREASTIRLQDLPGRVRIGRFGPFVEVERDGETLTASLPKDALPGELSATEVEALVRAKAEGPQSLGTDPQTGQAVLLLQGRFGPYVQLGAATEENKKPKRASLPKGVKPESVTLAQALRWLSLPRTLGPNPETGEEVQANVGRFGPYVVHAGEFRSLGPEDDVYRITLPRALELLAQPKAGRTRQRAGVEPLRTLGAHPVDGEPVAVFEGRYGPYVKHGAVNATLPRGVSAEAISLERALELLAAKTEQAGSGKARAARGAAGRGRGAAAKPKPAAGGRTPAKTAGKAPAKKAAAKKPAAAGAKRGGKKPGG